MVRKKREGNETQKRDAMRAGRREGESPSEAGVTTGASKQRNEEANEGKKSSSRRGRSDERD